MNQVSKQILVLLLLAMAIGSCFASNDVYVNDITIEPNPMEKNTLISITFVQKIHADIIIETLDGMVVKSLFSDDFTVGTYEFFWNRLDDNGEFVPEGEYNVTVNYNARYTSTKKTIILK